MSTSLSRMLSILDLFTDLKPIWTAEEITNTLNFSMPTGYRYLRALCDSGLLARVEGGYYIIGPKIIKLDNHMRRSDPIIAIGKSVIEELVNNTGCEVLLSNLYNDEVINIYEKTPNEKESNLSYSRGRPHPLFTGSTSKIILANLSRNRLMKLYKENKLIISKAKLGDNWEDFNKLLSKMKRDEFCISHGELDEGVTGIAVPIFQNNQIKGSLTLTLPTTRYSVFNIENLIELLKAAANEITDLISRQA